MPAQSLMSLSSPQIKWLWASLLVVILDQASKQFAELQLTPHQPVNLFPYFDWYLTYNTGAAFSLLADAGGWQRWLFTIIAIVISIVIVQWVRKLPGEETLTAVSLCLILNKLTQPPVIVVPQHKARQRVFTVSVETSGNQDDVRGVVCERGKPVALYRPTKLTTACTLR